MGIISFFIALAVVKALKIRLVNNVLAKMDIDDGIRHSLASGFGFIGFIIAAIIAITMMGGNLSNLALIASALSVGIGFGLQNIINNFVSGIIILFERPIKVGDWVIIREKKGRLNKLISARPKLKHSKIEHYYSECNSAVQLGYQPHAYQ